MSNKQKRIILITGIQAAGKTTISTGLAKILPRCACVHADELQRMILSGGVWQPDVGEPAGEPAQQLELRLKNMCLLGKSFYDAGFSVVMDDVIAGTRWEQFQKEMKSYPFELVILSPSVEVVLQRDKARNVRTIGAEWAEYLDHEFRTTMQGNGLWIDTSDLPVPETLHQIVCRLGLSIQLKSLK